MNSVYVIGYKDEKGNIVMEIGYVFETLDEATSWYERASVNGTIIKLNML